MLDIISVTGIIYILFALFIWIGLHRQPGNPGTKPITSGSLIICAKNEEQNLPACLDSVENQSLGHERLEIILVDDASRDNTAKLFDEYAGKSRFEVKVLHLSPPEAGAPSGKWRALKEGINAAENDALLLTDADAILPRSWAERHLDKLGESQVVAGFVLIEDEGLWSRIQRMDWLFLSSAGSSFSAWGLPQSAFGKNLALRRSSYDGVGGFEKIGFSLTEDLTLFRAIVEQGGSVSFPVDPELMVKAPAAPTWRQYTGQRKRWFSGFQYLPAMGKLCIILAALRHFSIIIGICMGITETWLIWLTTAAANFLIQRQTAQRLGIRGHFQSFISWEIFYTWSAPLLAFHFLGKRNIDWKGRKF